MTESFRHKGLKELFKSGRSGKIPSHSQERCLRRLDALNAAQNLGHVNLPGFDLHELRGKPLRYSVHVSGVWTITFGRTAPKAQLAELEQYH